MRYNLSFHHVEAQMVTDRQVRRLFMLINKEKSLAISASKAGMDEKTARKYLKSMKLPSQLKRHTPGQPEQILFNRCGMN